MPYDLIIVGAGIHGAGVAQAAAMAGYSVLLLEQGQVASATSSRSSKLIHGGLRYLESGQFALVRECLLARRHLLRLAPELVRLQTFHIPIYRHTQRRPWEIRLGLSFYALLNGLRSDGWFRREKAARWQELDGLRLDDLQAVYSYQDAQTDDAALTRAVVRSAQRFGAELLEHARLVNAEIHPAGVDVVYIRNGHRQQCRGRVLVNAAGPWVNQLLEQVTPAQAALAVQLVQGAHILLPDELLRGIYYLESPSDKRAVFAMPWQGQTLLGTTETVYTGDPAQVKPLDEEVEYLRRIYSHYFPNQNAAATPLEAFAGLRVLPASNQSAFQRSRDTIMLVDSPDRPRLISIYGGKLTAYMFTAQQLLHGLLPSLGEARRRADPFQEILTPVP